MAAPPAPPPQQPPRPCSGSAARPPRVCTLGMGTGAGGARVALDAPRGSDGGGVGARGPRRAARGTPLAWRSAKYARSRGFTQARPRALAHPTRRAPPCRRRAPPGRAGLGRVRRSAPSWATWARSARARCAAARHPFSNLRALWGASGQTAHILTRPAPRPKRPASVRPRPAHFARMPRVASQVCARTTSRPATEREGVNENSNSALRGGADARFGSDVRGSVASPAGDPNEGS